MSVRASNTIFVLCFAAGLYALSCLSVWIDAVTRAGVPADEMIGYIHAHAWFPFLALGGIILVSALLTPAFEA